MKFLNTTVCVLLFLLLLSGIFHLQISIHHHTLILFPIIGVLVLINVFIILACGSGADGVLVTGWKKYIALLFILVLTFFISYSSIYLPLNSKLIGELSEQQISQSEPITFFADPDKHYYIEVDSFHSLQGVYLDFYTSNKNYQHAFQIMVSKTNRTTMTGRGTEQITLPFTFPEKSEYSLSVYPNERSYLVKKIRIYEVNATGVAI
jgi:hypothetical protein